ncbi:uncharacterized protein MT2135-like [Asterias amurensis]|uniref:uncharacterized protein MT2135-like n=1 Tax=Asterias amurensis TaxID=7602 RepID=UPI003AB7A3EF
MMGLKSRMIRAVGFLLMVEGLACTVTEVDIRCKGISRQVGCTECSTEGHCLPGRVPVDPWLSFATKTQRELQIDDQWNRLQMLDAHNAYNARAYGYGYGVNDTCNWPPPYENNWCVALANQVLSFTDLLNMGIRSLEIDNWWCEDGAMRMAHLSDEAAIGCLPYHRLYADGIKEIADWLNSPGNEQEMVRIYLNEKFSQGHDEEVNRPLEQYLGKRMLTPAELKEDYGGVWPTVRQMRQAGKNVVMASGSTAGSGELYTHGGFFIHHIYWEDIKVNQFSNYPSCGTKNATNMIRYYSDGTHYGPIYDGVTSTGVILDFTEFIKCRIQYPATDFITPSLIQTALFTWAKGEPSGTLTSESCVWVSKTDWRWYLSDDCSIELHYACQNLDEPDDWTISASPGPSDPIRAECPPGYKFSIPQDGYRNQKLRESSSGLSLWINYQPWLPEPAGSTAPYVVSSVYLLLVTVTGTIFSIII